MKTILLIDSTLRDGNHAIRHQLNKDQIVKYAAAADQAGIPILIVGHGNGLGASSLQIGESLLSDKDMINFAKGQLKKTKLGVYCIPGFATVKRDIGPAIDLGVDVFCVGCHCTEADTTQSHIGYIRKRDKIVYSCLMMVHMIPQELLLQECLKAQSYGSSGVILMDSAGTLLPSDVKERVEFLVGKLDIPVGFHAHNNLGMAAANSVAAWEAGAGILDACSRGFGAGSGNAQLEVLVAILSRMGVETGVDLYKMLDASDLLEHEIAATLPVTTSTGIVSGMAGVFSGFIKHVERISTQYGVDVRDVLFELGKRKVVAGQEDLIVQTTIDLADKLRRSE